MPVEGRSLSTTRTPPWERSSLVFVCGPGLWLYCSKCPKIMPFQVHKYTVQSVQKSIASHTRKPRARTSYQRRTRLWLIARAPGLPLGGISGLGPDRSESRKSIESLFRLFKSIFEAVLPFFWRSEGPRDFPRSVIRSLPTTPEGGVTYVAMS